MLKNYKLIALRAYVNRTVDICPNKELLIEERDQGNKNHR